MTSHSWERDSTTAPYCTTVSVVWAEKTRIWRDNRDREVATVRGRFVQIVNGRGNLSPSNMDRSEVPSSSAKKSYCTQISDQPAYIRLDGQPLWTYYAGLAVLADAGRDRAQSIDSDPRIRI